MKNYRKTSHGIYDLKYHLVWITKYRKPVFRGKLSERLRDLIREVCTGLEVQIVKGHVSHDHVHILVSVPPYVSISKLMQSIKGRTSRKLLLEFREIGKTFWGCHLWARGYFAVSTGSVTDEIIAQYIEHQDLIERDRDDDFNVEA